MILIIIHGFHLKKNVNHGLFVSQYYKDIRQMNTPSRFKKYAFLFLLFDVMGIFSARLFAQAETQNGTFPFWKIKGNSGTNAATNFIGTIDGIDLVVRTNNTEKARVTSTGNIGIGVTAPFYKLEIANGATFGFGNGTDGAYKSRTETRNDAGLQGSAGAQSGDFETSSPVNYPAGASSWWHLIDTRHSNNANNYAMQISGSFFDQEMYFRKTNNSATTAWSRILSSSNLNTYAWSTTGNSATNPATNFIGTTDGVDWVIRTANTERARVTSGGNVGIGITVPTQKFDVQGGNGRINNAFIGDVGHGANWGGISHYLMASTTGYAMIESNDGAYTLVNKQNTGGGYIGFRVGNADKAVITNAGNLGVGTTGPAYRIDNVGNGGGNIDLRTTGRIWDNSTDGGMWLSDLQDCFMGNISPTQCGFWTSSVGWAAFNITKSNGYVGIGTTAPTSRLHVVSDGDNIPVIYGINTNTSSGTTSYGVRGECGSSGIGSAGVIGVSTNSGQNEIGVAGDYSLWGASVFGLAWASAYTDMPTSRDYGVFGVVNFYTGTAVYGKSLQFGATTYGVYSDGNFAATGTKAASVPTSKGNQLLYCVESPEIWFEEVGHAQLSNGTVTIPLDALFLETVVIDDAHPMEVFIQEKEETNGLIAKAGLSSFEVKEKANGTSNAKFSYRILAKRRNYQDHRFGVDANQPMEDNRNKFHYQEPTTTDPAVMKAFVDKVTREKEELDIKEHPKKSTMTGTFIEIKKSKPVNMDKKTELDENGMPKLR